MLRKKRKKSKKNGFTLIELVIYLFIVTVSLTVILSFGWMVFHSAIKSQAAREVQQNTRLAMERISQALINSSSVDFPVIGTSSDRISLSMQEDALNPTLFELNSGRLLMREGGGSSFNLVSERVRVAYLEFSNVSYADTPGTVRIKMRIEHINPGNLKEYDFSFYTEKTVSLRK